MKELNKDAQNLRTIYSENDVDRIENEVLRGGEGSGSDSGSGSDDQGVSSSFSDFKQAPDLYISLNNCWPKCTASVYVTGTKIRYPNGTLRFESVSATAVLSILGAEQTIPTGVDEQGRPTYVTYYVGSDTKTIIFSASVGSPITQSTYLFSLIHNSTAPNDKTPVNVHLTVSFTISNSNNPAITNLFLSD